MGIENAVERAKRNLSVVNCSRQFGKTRWAVTKSLSVALSKPKASIKYGSAFYEDLKKYIYPNFRAVLEDAPEDIASRIKITESQKEVVVSHPQGDSIIDLCGLDKNPDGLRGSKVDLAIIEEAGYVKNLYYVYFSVVFPMFTHNPHANCVMIGTPSESPDHEFVRYFMERAKKEDSYVHFTIEDNPLLSKERIEYIIQEYFQEVHSEEMWKAQYAKMRRELYGEVLINPENAIIPEFSVERNVNVVEKGEFFPYYHKYESMDLGVVDKTVCLFAYYDFTEAKAKIMDELVIHGPTMTTDEIAQKLKDKERSRFGEYPVYRRVSDSDNLLLIQDLSRLHGINFKTTSKESLHAMVNKVRLWMDQGRIEIDPTCKELIGCLKNGIWDNRRKQFERSTLYGHYDAVAALVYLIRNIDEHTNPIPVAYGLNINKHFITHQKQKEIQADRNISFAVKRR